MKKTNNDFDQLDLLKERYQQKITRQEQKITSTFSAIKDNLTGVALVNKLKENLFDGSGFAFKLGFMAVTLLQRRLSERKKMKS